MENTQQEVVQTQEQATPNTSVEVSKAAETQQTAAPVTEGQEAPQYSPSYKFNVMDKEQEFDEWIRPVIKNQEIEKKVKELYEKAYGLDYVKPKHEAKLKEFEDVSGKYNQLSGSVAEIMEFKKRGDLDTFFEKVGLSNDKIYDWILAKLNRQQLPPEQRKVYEDLEAKNRAEYAQSRQMEQMTAQYQQMAARTREMEVDFQLGKPEVNDIKSRYDAANGNGSFKAFVAEQGVLHYNLHGEDPSAEMAISMALKKLGDVWKGQPAQIPTSTASGEKPLPVIPNVSGKNVSPTRKAIRSVDDLKKIAADFNG